MSKMSVAMVVKSKRFKLLVVVGVCWSVIFAMLVLPLFVFPLSVNLSSHIVHVGDTISGTVTVTNKSGQNVQVFSNGRQPCIYFHKINERYNHVEVLLGEERILEAGDKMSCNFRYEVSESGIYIFDAHCSFNANSYPIYHKLYNIVIVLK
ncbi:MAG: hypothetical protein FWB84_07170 [Candidatus Bathyarchaeota archaeon]|uniref:hypothetical protein n=1 Tax=Candidatus Bathycorpusculum sp. TaxID=2994959 RepID=UPI0028356467|nr:hypothetical protein [Candidatus Termiticorpusculum sp.]MCL2257932.1 hypothetical protein [Candidatus Termiticorpusculum sp.]MCL2291919.1 hypothetical protein [Candidatus Termiticorpusculum sp.]